MKNEEMHNGGSLPNSSVLDATENVPSGCRCENRIILVVVIVIIITVGINVVEDIGNCYRAARNSKQAILLAYHARQ